MHGNGNLVLPSSVLFPRSPSIILPHTEFLHSNQNGGLNSSIKKFKKLTNVGLNFNKRVGKKKIGGILFTKPISTEFVLSKDIAMDALLACIIYAFVLAAGLSSIAAITLATQPTWMIWLLQKFVPDVLFIKSTKERIIALTIDDAPHKEITEEILDILKVNGCKATFFVIGSNMEECPELAQKIIQEGHELGNHTMHDAASWLLSPDEFEKDLLEMDEKLKNYFFKDSNQLPIKWFRPGHGIYTQKMLKVAKANGYRTVLGSLYPFDTLFKSMGKYIATYLLWRVHNGAIIVLHDRGEQAKQTPEILRYLLPQLRAQGYSLVTLTELLHTSK